MPTTSAFAIDVPESLLARARAGEAAAFDQLYRWFERPVFTLAMRILGSDRQEAADVLQDTMLKVLGRIGDFRGGSSVGAPFWAWLRQIAVNEALRARKRRTLHVPPPPQLLLFEVVAVG